MKTANARRRDAMSLIAPAIRRLEEGGAVTLARAPEGYDAFVVAELTRALAKDGEQRAVTLAFVARDGLRAQAFIDALSFAAPEIEALYFPSWDCQPYDRVSPNAAISAERMTVLARLAQEPGRRRAAAHSRRLGQRADAARAAARVSQVSPPSRPRPATACGWKTSRTGSRRTATRAPARCATSAITPRAAAFSTSIRLAPQRRSGSISLAIRSNRSAPSIRRRSARPRNCARSISCR